MTHTAGFCYGGDQSHVDSLYNQLVPGGMWSSGTLEELMKLMAGIPLKNQPGTKWEYSISIDVAGYLVEVLSGFHFDEFLQTRLFDPLGMDDTGFEVPEEDYDQLAMIYTKDEGSGELTPVESLTNGVKKEVTLFSGGGGLASTIGDYGKFGQMPSTTTYEDGDGYGLGGSVNLETGEYSWGGMASILFVADLKNNMVVLAFTQYISFMGVPFAEEYREIVRNAVVK